MRLVAQNFRREIVLSAAVVLVAQLAIAASPAAAADSAWSVEVAKIPATQYTRDAPNLRDAGARLSPHLGDYLGESRLGPVLDDVDARYFDGARFSGTADAGIAFDNLAHLESYIKGRVSGGDKPTGEDLVAHVDALVSSLTAVRLLADATIQDAEATIGPVPHHRPTSGPGTARPV
jgi:hypothetical protein